MTFQRSLFSSARGDWKTPPELYAELDKEFDFNLDVTDEHNGEFDAFSMTWPKRVYANPPYGPGIGRWLERAIYNIDMLDCRLAVFLLPARTDTRWFHNWVLPRASEIRFIRGRLRFVGAKNSAPFPSMLVIFR